MVAAYLPLFGFAQALTNSEATLTVQAGTTRYVASAVPPNGDLGTRGLIRGCAR